LFAEISLILEAAMDEVAIAEAVISGAVLLHGCSLENMSNILLDNLVRNDLRTHGGPRGISLTRSMSTAEAFCKAHEEEFTEILDDWYELKDGLATEDRQGAILVFARSNLSDLTIIDYDDNPDSDHSEHEERVLGEVDNVFHRLSAILVNQQELEWFRSVVDTNFRAMDEPADDLLQAIEKAESKIVFRENLVPAFSM
jgi:hypothetical protein